MKVDNRMITGNSYSSGVIEALILAAIPTVTGALELIFTSACTSSNGLPGSTAYFVKAQTEGTNIMCECSPVGSPITYLNVYTGSAWGTWKQPVDAVLLFTGSYYRSDYFKLTSPSVRQTINTPPTLSVLINNIRYTSTSSTAFNLDSAGSWDSATYATAANRAGKDFYIYACVPVSGNIPVFILSANTTYPTGYTASNSRKIGGFHCLCVSVGTTCYPFNNSRSDLSLLNDYYITHDFTIADTSRHWLKTYIAGDVIPFSIWDLSKKPQCTPEGMTYDPKSGLWVEIYLPSYSGGLLYSKYNQTVISGTTTPAFHQFKFSQQFRSQKKRLLTQYEFESISIGSPQGENIVYSAMPAGSGGHVAVSGQRIISNIGVEDATGVFWQWGEGQGIQGSTAAWVNAYDGNDLNVLGQYCLQPNAPIFGGDWGDGVFCGSRSYYWADAPLGLGAAYSGRGAALVSSQV